MGGAGLREVGDAAVPEAGHRSGQPDGETNASRWGRLSPQDATGISTLINLAAAIVAVAMIDNIVRMVFRILANLLS
jgi:hypothetical protein